MFLIYDLRENTFLLPEKTVWGNRRQVCDRLVEPCLQFEREQAREGERAV